VILDSRDGLTASNAKQEIEFSSNEATALPQPRLLSSNAKSGNDPLQASVEGKRLILSHYWQDGNNDHLLHTDNLSLHILQVGLTVAGAKLVFDLDSEAQRKSQRLSYGFAKDDHFM
jgi:hypothetical protein